jgi:hypothetical protein
MRTADCVKVSLYSLPLVVAINYITESQLNPDFYPFRNPLPFRLLGAGASIAVVLAIHRSVWRAHKKKMLDEDREFLCRWGHTSQYHSSLSEDSLSVEALISY